MALKQKDFDTTVGLVFLIVAVIHLLRAIQEWEFVVGGSNISLGVSWIIFFAAAYLAYNAFRLSK